MDTFNLFVLIAQATTTQKVYFLVFKMFRIRIFKTRNSSAVVVAVTIRDAERAERSSRRLLTRD